MRIDSYNVFASSNDINDLNNNANLDQTSQYMIQKENSNPNEVSFNDLSHNANTNQLLQCFTDVNYESNDLQSIDFQQKDPQTGMSFADVVTTLGRHEGLMKNAMDKDGLEKLRDDPNTPTDMKEALTTLLNNPSMFNVIDEATPGKVDGKLAAGDVEALLKTPQMKNYSDSLSESYTQNYIPSDAAPGSSPRAMTENDAMRELYLYSQSLPKNLSLQTLEDIANSSQDMDKCPPQVAADAKYFTDNPSEWNQLTGATTDKPNVNREKFLNDVSANIQLSHDEDSALKTIQDNEDIFFKKGGLTPDKLKSIADDTSNSQQVRDAAKLLDQPNSMLFSMLDNGKHGAGGNFANKSNDQNITSGDVDAFVKKWSGQVNDGYTVSTNQTPQDLKSQKDMSNGQETQPDQKKEMGGGLFKMLDILGWIGTAFTIFIPGVGEAAFGSGVAKTAVTAGIQAGVKAGAETAATSGTKAGLQAAMKEGVQAAKSAGQEASEQAEQAGEKGLKTAAMNTGQRAGKSAIDTGANQGISQASNSSNASKTDES